MWARDLVPNFAIIETAYSETSRDCYSKDSWLVWGSFITDHHLGPTKSPFTTCRVRRCLLLPRSSMGTLLLDVRPEAEFTFDPFGSTSLLHKVYVCVCEKFICSLFCPIGTHMGKQRWSGGFCNTVPRTQTATKHVCRVKSRLISSARICYWTQHNIIILTLWPWDGET